VKNREAVGRKQW